MPDRTARSRRSLCCHVDEPIADQLPVSSHQLDVPLLEPRQLAFVVPVADHLVAPRERRRCVDRPGDRLDGSRDSTSRGEDVAGADEGLARDATPVAALATNELALDQRHTQAPVGAAAGHGLPGRACSEDDHIEVVVHGH